MNQNQADTRFDHEIEGRQPMVAKLTKFCGRFPEANKSPLITAYFREFSRFLQIETKIGTVANDYFEDENTLDDITRVGTSW